MHPALWKSVSIAAIALAGLAAGARLAGPDSPEPDAATRVERGRALVNAFGCADCHTPLRMGPEGPYHDPELELAGHPEAEILPPPPELPPGPWNVTVAATNTAWSGPWGVSFPANLTPDPETGLGRWSESDFIQTVRTGRHLGRGREILPPMPIHALATMSDEDLGSIFAYLSSLPPVKNRVPSPLPPRPARG